MTKKPATQFLLPIALVLFVIFTATSRAAGPVDAEAGLTWWVHDVDTPELNNVTADGPGAYAEIWWDEAWGVGAEYFKTDPDTRRASSVSEFSFDLKRRLASPTENNFLAVGAGWKNQDVIGGGTADGFRLLLEGRVGVGILFGYGTLAWMPDLGDAGLRRDLDATEYQFGVSLTPFPFLNLRLGYRKSDLNFNGGSQTSDGFLLGAAIHF